MTITLGRFELEVLWLSLFLRIPYIGELTCNSVTPWCFEGRGDASERRKA